MTVFLGLGTNLGNKEHNLREAVQKIEERIGNIVSLSALYATAPWGFSSENGFLNAVVCINTILPVWDLLRETQVIEQEMGRSEKSAGAIYKDRLIDLDLLLYGDTVMREEELILPHPHMTERRFVMEPLVEIAPNLIHPVFGLSMKELLSSLP